MLLADALAAAGVVEWAVAAVAEVALAVVAPTAAAVAAAGAAAAVAVDSFATGRFAERRFSCFVLSTPTDCERRARAREISFSGPAVSAFFFFFSGSVACSGASAFLASARWAFWFSSPCGGFFVGWGAFSFCAAGVLPARLVSESLFPGEGVLSSCSDSVFCEAELCLIGRRGTVRRGPRRPVEATSASSRVLTSLAFFTAEAFGRALGDKFKVKSSAGRGRTRLGRAAGC